MILFDRNLLIRDSLRCNSKEVAPGVQRVARCYGRNYRNLWGEKARCLPDYASNFTPTESKDKAEWRPSVAAPAQKERFLLREDLPKRAKAFRSATRPSPTLEGSNESGPNCLNIEPLYPRVDLSFKSKLLQFQPKDQGNLWAGGGRSILRTSAFSRKLFFAFWEWFRSFTALEEYLKVIPVGRPWDTTLLGPSSH